MSHGGSRCATKSRDCMAKCNCVLLVVCFFAGMCNYIYTHARMHNTCAVQWRWWRHHNVPLMNRFFHSAEITWSNNMPDTRTHTHTRARIVSHQVGTRERDEALPRGLDCTMYSAHPQRRSMHGASCRLALWYVHPTAVRCSMLDLYARTHSAIGRDPVECASRIVNSESESRIIRSAAWHLH